MVKRKQTKPQQKRKPNKNNRRQRRNRAVVNAPLVQGQGDYLVDMGESVGKWLGGKAGGLISSVVSGSGDYKIRANSLMNSVPDFSNSAETRIKMREFLVDVKGSIAFRQRQLPIGVTELGMFPYLSRISKAFDEWELNGLLFTYKTTSGNVTTSQALGTVIMATQYNPYDAAFGSKQPMENYQYSSSTVPSESCIHAVECDPSMRQQPVLSVLPPAGPNVQDKRMYQFGAFTIATVGFPADDVVVGELWVTYDITLKIKAQRALTVQQSITFTAAQCATMTDALPFGSVSVDVGSGPIGSLSTSDGIITFAEGVYGRFLIQMWKDTTNAVATNTFFFTTMTGGVVADEVYGVQRNSADKFELGAEIAIDINGGGTLLLQTAGATGSGAITGAYLTIIEIAE